MAGWFNLLFSYFVERNLRASINLKI
jgi:hypothetical protein